MSLITRCPACGTLFKVVADQLRVSQGWVRCGNCSDVFDAGTHLLPAEADLALTSPGTAPQSLSDTQEKVSLSEALSKPAVAVSTDTFVGTEASAIEPSELFKRVEPLVSPVINEVRAVDRIVETPKTPESADASAQVTDAPVASFTDISFLRQARREAFWKKSSVRLVAITFGLFLFGLLGFQWVVQHKDRLALMDTRWHPVLQALCQPVNCVVKPLRRVEALVIDSSSFSKSGPESFRLSFVLKNMSDLPLEAPLLELTLTDTQDKAILRRVLTPDQFGYAAGALLPARAEAAGIVSLTVTTQNDRFPAVSAAAVAGYRVLVFYP